VGRSRLTLLYVSRHYTTHDRRFLGVFVAAGFDVYFLQLERASVTFERREVPDGVQVVDWPRAAEPSSIRNLAARIVDLARIVRAVRPDVILAGPVQAGAALVAAATGRPFVAMPWGSDLLVDTDRGAVSRWLTQFALWRASGVFGDCRAVRDKVHRLVRYRDDRIVTVPWGIDLAHFAPRADEADLRRELGWSSACVFISTRTWEPVYAIDVLVRAFADVHRRHRDTRLLLLGDGGQHEAIARLIDAHDLRDVVHTPGRIGYAELPRYFHAADVYVSTALSDGTSISLLEAMSCGLPAIVTNAYGNLEWIEPGLNGWLVPGGDVTALAGALTEAATDPGRRRRFGDASVPIARQRADWDRNAGQLVQLLRQVSANP
jgi:glycosyltransferase involved in cell wall biosynthesis